MNQQEFQELIMKEFPMWSSILTPNPGLQRVCLSAATMDDLCHNSKLRSQFIERLKNLLPEDATLYVLADLPLKVVTGIDGGLTSLRCIEFASRTWSTYYPDGRIPELSVDNLAY